ncbi:hypothetical protein [Salmonella enterica]|nr:hypothetical protein [Salmonella enterica]
MSITMDEEIKRWTAKRKSEAHINTARAIAMGAIAMGAIIKELL